MSTTTARRPRRAVLTLVLLAAVAALTAPADADPPPSGDSGDSGTGKALAAVQNPSGGDSSSNVDNIDVSGSGSEKNGPNVAIAGPPPVVVED